MTSFSMSRQLDDIKQNRVDCIVVNGTTTLTMLDELLTALPRDNPIHSLVIDSLTLDESIASLLRQLTAACPHLKKLTLSNLPLPLITIEHLFTDNTTLSTLTTLELHQNGLTADALCHLITSLGAEPQLKSLDLSFNPIGSAGADVLA